MTLLNSQNTGWQAVADLGTNTFQLLVARNVNGFMEVGVRVKTGVQIGKGGMSKRIICEDAVNRATSALNEFAILLSDFQLLPKECRTFATSAFRNAENADWVISEIYSHTRFQVEVIDGDTEANFIFNGVAASGALASDQNQLIVDIGGGSVEFILCEGRIAVWRQSFEIGGLRLMEKFHQTDPIPPESQQALETYLENALTPLWTQFVIWQPKVLVGCSGSFDTLIEMNQLKNEKTDSDIESQSNYFLTVFDFQELSKRLVEANLRDRLAMPGMISLRAEMMVVAVLIIQLLVRKMNCVKIEVSTWSLKEGAMVGRLNQI